jgi:putative GTP pyrophosphokinase
LNSDVERWLANILPLHEKLTGCVKNIVVDHLEKKNIDFLNIEASLKEMTRVIEKITRKKYTRPHEQLTDLSAVRVITCFKSQAREVSRTIEEIFEIDKENSEIYDLDLPIVGYRSTHYVCCLGKEKGEMHEYADIAQLKFEVQVRTALQHAWAEIAHDRTYKSGRTYPAGVQRKLNLCAAALELVEISFEDIEREISEYDTGISATSTQELSPLEISKESLDQYARVLSSTSSIPFKFFGIDDDVVKVLRFVGIMRIGDLERLITPDFTKAYKKYLANRPASASFLFDMIVLYHFADNYYVFRHTTKFLEERMYHFLVERYGEASVGILARKYSLMRLP